MKRGEIMTREDPHKVIAQEIAKRAAAAKKAGDHAERARQAANLRANKRARKNK